MSLNRDTWIARPLTAILFVLFFAATLPALGQDEKGDTKAALKERDRLELKGRKLHAEGNTAEAIATVKAAMEIESRVLGRDSLDVAGSLGWLAELHVACRDFTSARDEREQALAILRKRHGADHWKVVDARLALEDVARLAKLGPDQRRELDEADRLNDQVVQLYQDGKAREAVALARQVLAIRKEVLGERHPLCAESLNNLALQLESQGEYAAAKPLYEQALAITKAVLGEHHPAYAQSLNNLAALLQSQGDYAAAKPLFEQALAIVKAVEGEQHPDYATCLNNLAALLQDHGDYAAAKPYYEQALAIRKAVLGEQHPDYASSLNNLATVLESQGDYAAAKPLYVQALAIRKAVLGEHHPDYAQSLNNLAELLESQGDYATARPLHEQALAIRKAVLGERHPDYAQSLNNLAGVLDSQGDYAAAKPLYEQALAIRKAVLGERHPDYATNLSNLAGLLQAQGDYAAARPLYEQALAIRKAVLGERHPAYAQSLNNLALLLQAQGDYDAAKPLYEQALAIRKAALGERHPDFATSLNNLAGVLVSQGDYAPAKPLYEQALAIKKAVLGEHHPDYARSLNNLAHLLGLQGDYAAARPLHEQALAIKKAVLGERHPDYARSLNNLAFVLFAQHDFGGAAPMFERALEIGERNLDLTAAVQAERQQLAMAAAIHYGLDAYLTIGPLAKVPAGHAYRHVLTSKGAVLERQRHLGLLRRLGQAQPDSENAHLFISLEQTSTRLAMLALGTPDPKQADAWRTQVAELTRAKEDLESKLAGKDATFRAAQAEARRRPEDVQASLPPDAALIDFLEYKHFTPPAGGEGQFEFEEHLLAFVVRRDRPIVRIDLGPRAPIAEAVEGWRPLLRQPVAALDGPPRDLRKRVWEPLEPHLEGTATVLVSPDGVLGSVPLAALPGTKVGSYLIEDYTFAVVPVPRMLDTTAPTNPGGTPVQPAPTLLLVGDVEYGGAPGKADPQVVSRTAAVADRTGLFADFTPLPSTGDEIAAIGRYYRRRFPDGKAMELDGPDATEDAFRRQAPQQRYLHLATHGYFAPETLRSALGPGPSSRPRPGIDPLGGTTIAGFHPGLLSGIALAGANRRPAPTGADDGILTALEVASLDLSGCELAVLSACETGLGMTAGGEGLLGLQRAFQVAGARSVVASLWSVGDKPTQELMARFYENLWRKTCRRPRPYARRSFTCYERASTEEDSDRTPPTPGAEPARTPPFFWAAFVLSTDRP